MGNVKITIKTVAKIKTVQEFDYEDVSFGLNGGHRAYQVRGNQNFSAFIQVKQIKVRRCGVQSDINFYIYLILFNIFLSHF